MTLSTLSSNGQTTIPIEIRKFLGVAPSEKLLYRIEDGKVILETVGSSTESLFGSLSVDEQPGDEAKARSDYAKRKYGVK